MTASTLALRPRGTAVVGIAERMKSMLQLVAADDLRRLLNGSDGARLFQSIDSEINLHFGEPEFAVSFASATDGEQRASIALQYALLSAVFSSKLNVIYIDAGSDPAALSRRLHLDSGPAPGLHDVLSGDVPIAECFRATSLGNFTVAAGGSSSGAHAVFSATRFKALIAEALTRADRVVLDLPALATHREALGMVGAVPDCVLVIKARATSRARVDLALRDLDRAGARVIGTILSNYTSPFG